MACSFIARRVQSIKELAHPALEYSTSDSTKEVLDPPSLTQTITRLSKLFKVTIGELGKGIKEAYNLDTTRSKVSATQPLYSISSSCIYIPLKCLSYFV